jgi:hypothetical protein
MGSQTSRGGIITAAVLCVFDIDPLTGLFRISISNGLADRLQLVNERLRNLSAFLDRNVVGDDAPLFDDLSGAITCFRDRVVRL